MEDVSPGGGDRGSRWISAPQLGDQRVNVDDMIGSGEKQPKHATNLSWKWSACGSLAKDFKGPEDLEKQHYPLILSTRCGHTTSYLRPYIHRPWRELGGSRAPSFAVPRCIHYRPPARSAHRIVPR